MIDSAEILVNINHKGVCQIDASFHQNGNYARKTAECTILSMDNMMSAMFEQAQVDLDYIEADGVVNEQGRSI